MWLELSLGPTLGTAFPTYAGSGKYFLVGWFSEGIGRLELNASLKRSQGQTEGVLLQPSLRWGRCIEAFGPTTCPTLESFLTYFLNYLPS